MPDTTPTPMPAICGDRHESWPETVCTEPPAHRMPHGGPLIINGRECGGAAWGPDDGYADAQPAPVPDPALVLRAADGPTWAALADIISTLPPAPPGPYPDSILRARAAAALLARIKLAAVQPEPRRPGQIGSLFAATEYDLADTVLAELAPELADRRARVEQAEELLSIAHDTSNRSEAERAAAVRRAEQAEAAVRAVRRLHEQYAFGGDPGWYCAHCNQISGAWIPWPCPTVRALTPTADTPKEPTT